MKAYHFAALCGCASLGACQTALVTRPIGRNDTGIAYALAKGVVPVTVQQASCEGTASGDAPVGDPKAAGPAKVAAAPAAPNDPDLAANTARPAQIVTELLPIFNVAFGEPKVVADRTRQLHYRPSAFSDDTLTITTDKGLLTLVSAHLQDRTGDVITKLADLAKEAFLAAHGLANAPGSEIPNMKMVNRFTCAKPLQWTALDTFDWEPGDEADTTDLNTAIGGVVTRQMGFIPDTQDKKRPANQSITVTSSGLQDKNMKVDQPTCASFSICYRPLKSYSLKAKINDISVSAKTVTLPDTDDIAGLDVRRDLFVKVDTSIVFVDGAPTKVDISKPSSVAAGLDIPIAVAKTIGSIPGAAVAGLTAKIGKQTSLVDAQTAQLKAQADNLTQQAAVVTATTNLLAAQKTQQGAGNTSQTTGGAPQGH